ncbi:hypothetical protein Prudu_015993 [Prunus dulcis]|uniref:Uncharacterized protein n=1 Tax=Prunus dulcis TaxID=3755 RepID=A0A4Y1RKJ5_PRUDU|nr:hypothetical protein Prudu_015993 [Prunus dulcis]
MPQPILVCMCLICIVVFIALRISLTIHGGEEPDCLLGNHNPGIAVNVTKDSGSVDSVSLPKEITESSSTKLRDEGHHINVVFNDQSGDFNLRTKDVFGIQEHGIENFGQHSVSKKELEPYDHNDQARDLIENEAQSDKNLVEAVDPEKYIDQRIKSNSDSCLGKYIYVHDIPSKFYKDLLQKCGSLSNWTNMCDFASNSGLGPIFRISRESTQILVGFLQTSSC